MCVLISRSENSFKDEKKIYIFKCIYSKRRSVCLNQNVSNICFTSHVIAEMTLRQLNYSLRNNLLIASHVALCIPCSYCVCSHCGVKQNFPLYDIIQNLLQCEVVKWHCKCFGLQKTHSKKSGSRANLGPLVTLHTNLNE